MVELFNGTSYITTCQLLDDRLQARIFLADDLVEACGGHASLLELVIRTASIHRFMLAHVADQQHAILRSETMEERVHLLCAGQAGFVEHIQPLRFRARLFLGSHEMALQSACLDSGRAELLRRS